MTLFKRGHAMPNLVKFIVNQKAANAGDRMSVHPNPDKETQGAEWSDTRKHRLT